MFDSIVQVFMQYGLAGLFALSFLDAIVLPVPPFFLQIAMSLIEPEASLRIATVAFTGSVLGAPIGYMLGKWLGKPLMHKLVPAKWANKAMELFEKNGDAAVIIGSFTPIPFKVFTILSGVFNFSLTRLMFYSILGRGSKFFLIGTLFHFYGKQAKVLLDNYLEVSLLGVAVILAAGWYILRKRKQKFLSK
ncbi:YqaA family protein [Brevibacillus fluminis]|uniref:YqaA family protein n=1 Tax=Brevibacillus fluminis TaxID=511487 RepID=UPI003F89E4D6